MNERRNTGSNLAKASLCCGLTALFAPPILSVILMGAIARASARVPFSDMVILTLFALPSACGAVAAICGHMARRRLDVTTSPQKSAIALAGLLIGYSVIVNSISAQIASRLASYALKDM